MSAETGFNIFVGVAALVIGAALGAVAMKETTHTELRSLRARAQQLGSDARKCCDTALYVLDKYGGTPARCEPKPAEKP